MDGIQEAEDANEYANEDVREENHMQQLPFVIDNYNK